MVDLLELAARLGAGLLDDVANAAFLPVREYRHQQVAAVGEVPVKTALGYLEPFRQHFDAQARDAFLGEHLGGAGDPGGPVELGTRLFHDVFHTQ